MRMKTAISIPDDLFLVAEQAAKRLGLSRSELYRRAIGAFLQRNNDKLVTDALNEVYDKQAGEDHLDPSLLQMQSASLEQEEW
jgi:metal-responsive CopG/Arc/MetJ family transcriptional regulator